MEGQREGGEEHEKQREAITEGENTPVKGMSKSNFSFFVSPAPAILFLSSRRSEKANKNIRDTTGWSRSKQKGEEERY